MMARGKRAAVWALLVTSFLVFPAYVSRSQVSGWLEAATGEADTFEQLKGLVKAFRQRPLRTEDMAAVRFAGVNPFGANTFFEQEVEESKLRRSMQLLREAGITWVRQQFPWDRIEVNKKGDFNSQFGSTWAQYDRIVTLAQEYGIRIVARLDIPPDWARRDNSERRSPPDNYQDYGDFVAAVASRYKGKIHHYQIWNEPNLVAEWGKTPSAEDYVRLLRTAYQRAKAIDPGVVILSAALAPTLGTPDGLNESDLTYLQAMYDAGGGNFFDVLSAQGYGLWTGPGDRVAEPGHVNMSRVQLLREVMVRNGDAEKAIWISELGWDAVPQDFTLEPLLHGQVTEERQARYTAVALRRIQEEWPWVGVVFYWHFRKVTDEARRNEEFYFRMVDPDFTIKPVYGAIQGVANQPPTVNSGWRQNDHYALQFKGVWRDLPPPQGSPLGRTGPRLSATAGNTLELRFQGTGLTLVTARGPAAGQATVSIDGSGTRANMLPSTSGRSRTLNLAADQREAIALAPLALGLDSGNHSVSIKTLNNGDVVIHGVVVYGADSPWKDRVVAVALYGGSVLGLVVAVRSYRSRSPGEE